MILILNGQYDTRREIFAKNIHYMGEIFEYEKFVIFSATKKDSYSEKNVWLNYCNIQTEHTFSNNI